MTRRPRLSTGTSWSGIGLLAVVALSAVAAPVLAPHDAGEAFRGFLYAPPMRPHVVADDGTWRAPFVYPLRLVSRLEQRYEEDRAHPASLAFFSGWKVIGVADERAGPWLPLGADASGRDQLTRLLFGARTSLGVALLATLGALLIGGIAGGIAGYSGGALDEALMRVAEFVLVLPAVYVVLALRAALPLVLPAWIVFVLMAGIFAVVGWPWVARAVRATVAAERTREYADAARSLGAGHARVLLRHLMPACRGLMATQAILLLPTFIVAEATLSFIGLGFPDAVPSWGSMLHEAANVNAMADFPWTLAPAAAIFAVTLGANLVLERSTQEPHRAQRT
ncbi:MAG TPA: ABC transporter permease [Vicinamibacterales bacterium]